ncbi:MAG: hypothetical protein IPJ16_11500 [Bacteroidales bacterium]|nr:hypothetical protein [Bacteroidales bacterium]
MRDIIIKIFIKVIFFFNKVTRLYNILIIKIKYKDHLTILKSSAVPHVINCLTRNYFVKISPFNRHIKNEYLSYLNCSNAYPELKDLLFETTFRDNFFYKELSSELASDEVDKSEHFIAAIYCLNRFRKYSTLRIIDKLTELEFINSGLKVINQKCGLSWEKKTQNCLKAILDKPVDIGPCHGDFHKRNILKKEGQYKLIDWDSFRINDIQALDAFHYLIDQYLGDSYWLNSFYNFLIDDLEVQKELLRPF